MKPEPPPIAQPPVKPPAPRIQVASAEPAPSAPLPMLVKVTDVELPFTSVFALALQFWMAGVVIGVVVLGVVWFGRAIVSG